MSTTTSLLEQLRDWRDAEARRTSLPAYRILPNSTLETIAHALPKNKDDLCRIKGIKEAKFRQYGKQILALVAPYLDDRAENTGKGIQDTEKNGGSISPVPDAPYRVADTLTVSQFLDGLNLELSGMAARIRGEVTSVDARERVVYFSLKDKEDESVLNCLIFRYQYDTVGVKLSLGDEVIVEGVPDIYKPSGRLSMKVGSIEYAGEGALKKAYDALYKKLDGSGVFAPENKRPLPKFPERMALITSQEGAAIGDFMMNLTRAGLQVHLYSTLVEGKRAVFEIIKAIEYFNARAEEYDVLVIIRGGGSLESLQAFNTEALVQAVRASKIPVLAGIGHERDVSLTALAADHMVSTPTATAKYLSASWDEARQLIERETLFLETTTDKILAELERTVTLRQEELSSQLDMILERVGAVQQQFQERIILLPGYIRDVRSKLETCFPYWKTLFDVGSRRTHDMLLDIGVRLEQYNPHRVLRLGYSLVRKEGRLMRNAGDMRVGEIIDIELGSGRIEGEVKRVIVGSE